MPHLISDQNVPKTIPFGAAHTYMAYIREYPQEGGGVRVIIQH